MEKIFQWFDDNYLEEKVSIVKIIEEASIKHSCNPQSLFESCQILKQYYPKKTALRREVKNLAKLADYGIRGADAGKKLGVFFDINQIIHD